MKLRRPSTEAFVAVLLLLALGALAVLQQFLTPPPAVTGDSHGANDFAPGGYRAWYTLLTREGAHVEQFELRTVALDDSVDTLISAPSLVSGRSENELVALAAWVRRGGRLVTFGRVTLGDARVNAPREIVAKGRGDGGPLRGPLAATVRNLPVRSATRFTKLPHGARALLADRRGALVVREPLGMGTITFVADAVILTNRNLARGDTAILATELARPREAGGGIAFDEAVHGVLRDRPWWSALSVPVLLALAIAAFAVALWIIGSTLRSGAAVRLEPAREPTSAEFLAALADLYTRRRAHAYARDVLTESAFTVVARRLGARDDVPPEVLVARTAHVRGGADVAALATLATQPTTSDEDLLKNARLAFTVRKEFQDGNGHRRRTAFDGGTRTRRRR
jgi:hypothetical protein